MICIISAGLKFLQLHSFFGFYEFCKDLSGNILKEIYAPSLSFYLML